jgi:hypothetical protein
VLDCITKLGRNSAFTLHIMEDIILDGFVPPDQSVNESKYPQVLEFLQNTRFENN